MSETIEKQRSNKDNLKPFKKGQSGNPKGRPKKSKCIPEILRKITDEKDKNGVTKLNMILNNVVINNGVTLVLDETDVAYDVTKYDLTITLSASDSAVDIIIN